MATAQDVLTLSYSLLREDPSDVSAYPEPLLLAMIDTVQADFCSGQMINPVPLNSELRIAKKGQLPFLFTDAYYQNIQPVYTDSDIDIGDSIITVEDTTMYPDSWKLYMAGNTVLYTWNTGTSFTGCSNILYPFANGTQISFVFDLPTDFMSPIQVIYNNQFKLPAKLYDDVFEDLNSIKSNYYNNYNTVNNSNNVFSNWMAFYTIKENKELIIWNRNDTGGMIHLRYEKKPTELTTAETELTIDNDSYSKLLLTYAACGEILYSRWEEDRAAKLYNHALAIAKKAYNFYNNIMFEDINWTRVQADKWRWYNI